MKTVFIVDDESGTVEALGAVLGDTGFRIASASNGREALAALPSARPDVILLDYFMPVMDGGETLRALRRNPALATIPVVIISGLPESMIRRRIGTYDAFLRKPFGIDDLLATIRRVLPAPRRRTRRR